MFKKKQKQLNIGKVITPVGHPNPPEPHEEEIAKILATHFGTTVEFLIPIDDYKRKTPDIKMLGSEWEIKSPTGNSKSTIYKQFRRATKQADNIIIDTRRTKIKYEKIENAAIIEFRKRPSIKRVLLIRKIGKIIGKSEIVIEINK